MPQNKQTISGVEEDWLDDGLPNEHLFAEDPAVAPIQTDNHSKIKFIAYTLIAIYAASLVVAELSTHQIAG